MTADNLEITKSVAGSLNAAAAVAKPPLEKSTFAVVGDQCQCSRVASCGFFEGAQASQQIRASRMQQMVVLEMAGSGKRIDEPERGFRTFHHRDGDGTVQ